MAVDRRRQVEMRRRMRDYIEEVTEREKLEG